MAITDQLKQAIADSGRTHYAIGKGADVAPHVLDRFMSGERPHLRTDTVNKLCEYFGLELCRKKGRSARKRPAKKPATSRKRSAKKK
ncbi:MAG: hypothetical protein IH899_04645 [Planctomycetes bacterium]|nr:hypothetical protein [Planctomycetota bacterium]